VAGGLSSSSGQTVRVASTDRPRDSGGLSEKDSRTSSTAPSITDHPWRHLGPSATNTPHADCPRTSGGPSSKLPIIEDGWKTGLKGRRSRTSDEHQEHQLSQLHADRPRPTCGLSARCGQSSLSPKPRSQTPLSIHGSPKQLELLKKDLREMWSVPRGCYAPKLKTSNELNRRESNHNWAQPKTYVPTEILQSEAKFGVWGVMIKYKDAQGNYPWSPPTNLNPNTFESKEQAAHENPTKITRKRHENHTCYKREIDATMKASIHSEVRFFTNEEKSNSMEQGNEKQSRWMVCLETLELIYMSPSRTRQMTTLPLALKLWYKPLRGK
jgi:hypothetical protein